MNANVDIRIDRGVGKFLLPQLQDVKHRLWIMSPWVAAEYMELALAKKTTGVDVRVVTSNDYVSGQKNALSKLLEKKTKVTKSENKNLKYVGIGLFIAGIVLYKVTHGFSLLVSLLGVLIFMFGLEKSESYWVSKIGEGNLKVLQHNPYNMVHAKVFIVDDAVIIGSANLTGNGLKHNTEALALVQDPEIIQTTMNDMDKIEIISGLKTVSYNTIGRDIESEEQGQKFYRRRRVRV